MILRKRRDICEVAQPVVGVKIQKHAAFFQDAHPVPVGAPHMGQGPGQISGDHHVKSPVREIHVFRVHNDKFTVRVFLRRKDLRVFDHIRRKIHSRHPVSFFRQKNREKSRSAAHIQDPEPFPGGKLRPYLLHPALRHGAVKFLSFVSEKITAPFFPVVDDTFLALVIGIDHFSVGDHGTVSHHLKTSRLIKDHAAELRYADFFYISLIIPDLSQLFASVDHISRLAAGIPEAVLGSVLIADVRYLQRIISPVILLALIHSQMAENIPHIPSGRTDFLTVPSAHTAPFYKNAGNSLRRGVIVGSAGSHIGFHHIRHIHLFRHPAGHGRHFSVRPARIINVGRKLFIIVSAVKIYIVIRSRQQFLRSRPGKSLCFRAVLFSGKHPVQIFLIRVTETSTALLKGSAVHHFYNDHRSGHLLDF